VLNSPALEDCGINDINFQQVHFTPVPGTSPVADVLVQLPAKYKHFIVVSVLTLAANNSLYFHLSKLNKAYPLGDSAIHNDGKEQWFAMFTRTAGGGTIGSILLKFQQPVNQFYLDAGFEVGGGTAWDVMIACFNDDFDFRDNFSFATEL
jgi:hypothetical protein